MCREWILELVARDCENSAKARPAVTPAGEQAQLLQA